MIVLVEPMCSSWEHEEVNAGLLRLIDCVTKDRITYYGDEGQIKSVSRIYSSDKISFKKNIIMPRKEKLDSYKVFAVYAEILGWIIAKSKPDTLVITSGDRPCMIAAGIIAKMNPGINIVMVLHGIFDPKLGHTSSCIKIMKMNSNRKNLKWITYSSFAEKEVKKNNIENIAFLHLPYIGNINKKEISYEHEKFRIGIIGASANENAVRLVEAVGRTEDIAEQFEFWVLSRYSSFFRGMKNVRIMQAEFERSYMEKFMQQIDYVLLPYGINDYRMATSGVLMDAISNRVPCLAYDSLCIRYYQERYNIGIQKSTLSELLDELKKLKTDNAESREYFINMESLERENQDVMKACVGR